MNETISSLSLRRAIFLSAALNCLMLLTGTIANLIRPLRWLGWIARGIGTPPGLVLRFLIHPNEHSVGSYALAAVEGLVGSVVFYILVAWGAFWLYARRRREPRADQT